MLPPTTSLATTFRRYIPGASGTDFQYTDDPFSDLLSRSVGTSTLTTSSNTFTTRRDIDVMRAYRLTVAFETEFFCVNCRSLRSNDNVILVSTVESVTRM